MEVHAYKKNIEVHSGRNTNSRWAYQSISAVKSNQSRHSALMLAEELRRYRRMADAFMANNQ